MSSKPFFSCGFLLQFWFFSVFSLSLFNPIHYRKGGQRRSNTTTRRRQPATGTTLPPSLRKTEDDFVDAEMRTNNESPASFIHEWKRSWRTVLSQCCEIVKIRLQDCSAFELHRQIQRSSAPNPISSAQLPITAWPDESGSSSSPSSSSTFSNRLTVRVLTVYSSTRRTLHVEWRHSVTSKYWPVY